MEAVTQLSDTASRQWSHEDAKSRGRKASLPGVWTAGGWKLHISSTHQLLLQKRFGMEGQNEAGVDASMTPPKQTLTESFPL